MYSPGNENQVKVPVRSLEGVFPPAPPAPPTPSATAPDPDQIDLFDELDALTDVDELDEALDFEFDFDGLLDDDEPVRGKHAAVPMQVTDALKDKQSRISAVSYLLSSGDRIDYGRWSFLAMQLRYSDRHELMKLTAALMPGTTDWEDDGLAFSFKSAGVPCRIGTMGGDFTVTAEIGSIYPQVTPDELSPELKLAKAYFECEKGNDIEGAQEAGQCLFEIGGQTELRHFRTATRAFYPVHVPNKEYYAFELRQAMRHIALQEAISKHSKVDNPIAMQRAKKAHAVLGELFPDDMIHFAYDWKGSHDGSWMYFDSLVENFDIDH